MQWLAVDIFGERVLFGRHHVVVANDARDRLGLGQAALFDQLLQGAVAATTGGHFELARFIALVVTLGADGQACEEAAPFDIGGEAVDRHACFHAADVRLA